AFLAQLIVRLRGAPAQSPLARAVTEIVDAWATRRGLLYERAEEGPLETPVEALPRWAKFLLAFDVGYRERRLHFLVEGQNRLYQLLDEARFAGLDPLAVDRLKREFYAHLDGLRRREAAAFYGAKTAELVAQIFPLSPSAGEMQNVKAFAGRFVDDHGGALDRLMDQLSGEIALDATTRDLDELLATP